ncbi:MAG: hypothetical protein IPH17_10115 [Bacteroidales bacterium]|nr:hypothetical protein [Bacteroidales bacterium]
MHRIIISITFISLLFYCNLFSQVKIKLDNADILKYSTTRGDIQILVGNVSFSHEGNYLFCDSAYLYSDENRVEAFGNVSLVGKNHITLTAKYINYNGDNQIAKAKNNVYLTDGYYVLKTNELEYDLQNDIAFYLDKGVITDPYQTIISKKGYYYGENEDLAFAINVEINANDYKIITDSMRYNAKNEFVFFFDNTTITDTNIMIYCNYGIYDMRNDTFFFANHPIIYYDSYYIEADTVQFYRNEGLTKARSNAIILDTINDIRILGPFIKLSQNDSSIFTAKPSILDIFTHDDTLTIISDTLTTLYDSLKGREFVFNKNVHVFQNNIQAACDSLVYNQKDSAFYLFKNPIFWYDSIQMTADTIVLFLKNDSLDIMLGYQNAFIIEPYKDSLYSLYNQIKGMSVKIKFKNNQIDSLIMDRQCELTYYLIDDEKKMIGVNYSTGNQIILVFKDDDLNKIKIFDDPKSTCLSD